jgi:hypothetical protein
MDIWQWLKDNTGILSLLLIIACVLLLPLTMIGFYKELQDYDTEGVQEFRDTVGDWDKIIFLLSILGLLVGLAYFYSFQSNHRKFIKLVDTSSKQTFIKYQEDIEFLAWKLGTKYEHIVRMKKKELGIEKKKKKKKKRR